jgi:outer membrane lipoprotein SlyB
MASVRRIIVGICAAWLVSTGLPVAAQSGGAPPAGSTVRIDGIDVEEVPQLSVGTRLSFSVFGTPGAVASLQIEGARNGLLLREDEPGVYEGIYTIDAEDRIAAGGPVVATLRRGADVTRSVLDEPLVLGAAMPDAQPVPERRAAWDEPARLPAPARQASPPAPDLQPVPSRRAAPLDATTADAAQPAPPPARPWAARPLPRRAAACADCAVVESIRPVETTDRDGVAGALTGGLLGAILGHQIGHGDARGFASIVGAIGGALTGRAIERAGNRRVRYDVVLRLPDGASQIHSFETPPPLRVGDRVRVPSVSYARAKD